MSQETWKEEHRAVVCCVCGKRGPAVIGGEREALTAAEAMKWWADHFSLRVKVPVLAGAGSFGGMQQSNYCSHRIDFEEKYEDEWRAVCPICLRKIRGDGEP